MVFVKTFAVFQVLIIFIIFIADKVMMNSYKRNKIADICLNLQNLLRLILDLNIIIIDKFFLRQFNRCSCEKNHLLKGNIDIHDLLIGMS